MSRLPTKERYMEFAAAATIMTVIAGSVTIAWFIRDVRKQNSKILKEIEKGQMEGFERQENILLKVEEGQREGFKALPNDLVKIEEGQRKGFETLENGQQVMVKIQERIEGNTR